MDKNKGILFYNEENDRIGIKFDDGTVEDGLHCGQTMEVLINGQWIPTRIEMSDEWYLVGVKSLELLEGIQVKIEEDKNV